jgi:enoyl-[acyl-carrier protein] reductase II
VRALSNPATERFRAVQREIIDRFNKGELAQKDAQLEIEHFWAGALRRAVIEGDIEAGSLMAGQSVGMVTREQSTADILAELVGQALAINGVRERRLRKPPPFAGAAEGPGAAEGQDRGG